ncbi:C45 family autoproteolytic acyltransferase/hydrolase [Bacillus cereus group sp. MYBK71-2]|uniref:C45 family autoproteolytic acyltransferase/hydolase n=1 Tax=Bacillus cereus group TaxID=86661 RepID=UPI000CD8456F|nr:MULTISPECIES: C45 family peptidase [Bacillus cereus group]MCC2341510.1 C45 family peptidase [Bacillus tropicus]MCC2474246.1 C45 family peptidase [Bacillus pacificus]MCU5425088.1 C45 family peptidase [Bacillus tropicus]MDA1651061.1 C45 family autoproteolytic acyltransferase/hydrolase [Bacillus cereus group sp. TH160LC]MDA1798219.1 C45 family autoproteolytic acyltransferase/hydrolase [Bacillus cereus group sp. BY6-1LC]
MYQVKGYFSSLKGSHYEIGKQQGEFVEQHPFLIPQFIEQENLISHNHWTESRNILNQYCSGINEEIEGFCEVLKIPTKNMMYYYQTLLKAGCSHCVVLPKKTDSKHTYVLRNYDLSPKIDDMRFCSTHVKGAYAHSGFSTQYFGRTEGVNEHGLSVTFSACGQPVGNIEGLRKPVVSGLQCFAVIRLLLEKCKNVQEAKSLIEEIPIASNINLIVADPLDAARIEIFDGYKSITSIDEESQDFIVSTNHAISLPIQKLSNRRLEQSTNRYHTLYEYLNRNELVSLESLKGLVEKEYPTGLTVHNYEEWFGTLHSVLFDLHNRTMNICFGSPLLNDWYSLKVGGSMPFSEVNVNFKNKTYTDFWREDKKKLIPKR